jgi:hypothetical protein
LLSVGASIDQARLMTEEKQLAEARADFTTAAAALAGLSREQVRWGAWHESRTTRWQVVVDVGA